MVKVNRIPPHDLDAEQAVLGAMLLSADVVERVIDVVVPDDFYKPAHQQIFDAVTAVHASGDHVDAVTVADALKVFDALDAAGGVKYLLELQAATPSVSNAGRYATIVAAHANRRRIIRAAAEITEAAYDTTVPDAVDAAQQVWDGISHSARGLPKRLDDMTVTAGINRPAAERAVPIVPHFLHARSRTLLVAGEGFGKAVLLRQIGMSISQGIHPFRYHAIDPVSVVYLDLETGQEAVDHQQGLVWRGLQPKLAAVGQPEFDDSTYTAYNDDAGINLRSRVGKDLIRSLCEHARPKVVIIGPAYNAWPKRQSEDWADPVIEARRLTDELRRRYGCAVMLEAHAPQGEGASRFLRPEGSTMWMKWPDTGIALYPVADSSPRKAKVSHFRGARLPVEWPEELEQGVGIGRMPWSATFSGPPPAAADEDF